MKTPLNIPLHYELAINFLRPNEKDILCDIGGGDGVLWRIITLYQSTNLPMYVLIDIDQKALRRAKYASRSTHTHIICGSATALPLRKGVITKVTCLELMEHLSLNDVNIALNEAHRVLKNRGVLVLSTPHYSSSFLINLLDYGWLAGHKHFKVAEVKALLSKAGFKVLNLKIFGGLLSYLGGYWIIFWLFILKRLVGNKITPLYYSVMPLENLVLRISRIDAYKLGKRGRQLIVKAVT